MGGGHTIGIPCCAYDRGGHRYVDVLVFDVHQWEMNRET